jgi:hypothetical protein
MWKKTGWKLQILPRHSVTTAFVNESESEGWMN